MDVKINNISYPLKGIDEPDIRCPRCMDEERLSNVMVYWTSQNEGGKVLKCACTNGHEFTHEVAVSDE